MGRRAFLISSLVGLSLAIPDELYFHNGFQPALPKQTPNTLVPNKPTSPSDADLAQITADPAAARVADYSWAKNLKGRQFTDSSDPLGWNDPYTCNVGVCPRADDTYCTVFRTALPAMGICCEIGRNCDPYTVCVPYASHSDILTDLTGAVATAGTVYCGASIPYCIQVNVAYGYKKDILKITNCYSEPVSAMTDLNPMWTDYTSSPGETPTGTPNIITKSFLTRDPDNTSVPGTNNPDPSQSLDITVTQTPVDDRLSAGAIAGIAVGVVALVCLTALAIAFMYFRRRRQDKEVEASGTTHDPQNPAPNMSYAPSSQGPLNSNDGRHYSHQFSDSGVPTLSSNQGYRGAPSPQQLPANYHGSPNSNPTDLGGQPNPMYPGGGHNGANPEDNNLPTYDRSEPPQIATPSTMFR